MDSEIRDRLIRYGGEIEDLRFLFSNLESTVVKMYKMLDETARYAKELEIENAALKKQNQELHKASVMLAILLRRRDTDDLEDRDIDV